MAVTDALRELRTELAAATLYHAQLLGRTMSLRPTSGAVPTAWSALGAIIRGLNAKERSWIGLRGLTVEKAIDLPRQGDFNPSDVVPQRVEAVDDDGTVWQILEVSSDAAEVPSGQVDPGCAMVTLYVVKHLPPLGVSANG